MTEHPSSDDPNDASDDSASFNNNPFGGAGPFGAMPGMDPASLGAAFEMFGRMLRENDSGPMSWDTVRETARQQLVQQGDRAITGGQGQSTDQTFRLAQLWLDEATTFPASATTVSVWSGSEWLEETIPAWKPLIEPIAQAVQNSMQQTERSITDADMAAAAEDPDSPLSQLPPEFLAQLLPMMNMAKQVGSMMFSVQVGQALATLAQEVLSAGDVGLPLTNPPQAALLPQNIADFSEGLGVSTEDVWLFLSLREAAHQRLYATVPWLQQRVVGAVTEYARGIEVNMAAMQDRMSHMDPSELQDFGINLEDFDLSGMGAGEMPDFSSLQDAMSAGMFEVEQTPAQAAALSRIETLLALIDGWVDDVITTAATERLPAAGALAETIRRRRAIGGPAEKTFGTLVGLEIRPRKLREAAALFRQLRTEHGIAERDRLWEHPDFLPDASDLDDVDAFIQRSFSSDPSDFPDIPWTDSSDSSE